MIIPDGTRTVPLDVMFKIFYKHLSGKVKALHFLIALGTHQPMSEEKIAERVGLTPDALKHEYPAARIFNHRWDLPGTFADIGTISADEIDQDQRRAVPRGTDRYDQQDDISTTTS